MRPRTIGVAVIAVACSLACAPGAVAQRFYPDDPLTAEPPPYATYDPQPRALSEILELVSNTLGRPGERHLDSGVIGALGVNTLGEVLDGPWFVNRHATRRMTEGELIAGVGTDHAPLEDAQWQILTVRPYGVRPGMLVADRRNQVYLLLFDPPGNLEMSTGAHMVSSRIAHAIGYHVPESHIVSFERERLVIAEGGEIVSSAGNVRPLVEKDVDGFLRGVARTALGRYRALALYLSPAEWAGLLGPYQMYATRSDDPNDIVPHEHRRDLRGMSIVSAWLNHASMRAVSTHDVLYNADDTPRIRHYLVDLFATLGSGYDEMKRAQEGNDPFFDGGAALRNIVGFGLWTPDWMRARYPGIPAVGRFEAKTFDPERWTTTEALASFDNRLPDDEFWGAKQVMAFTDDDIRAVVSAGQYTDPEASQWIAETLIARRDTIGHVYFSKVLPLDRFRVEDGVLAFDDLAARSGLRAARRHTVRWLRLNNLSGALIRLPGAESFTLPPAVLQAGSNSYHAARIEAEGLHPEMNVTVYLRGGREVVGIDRGWPGKTLADPAADENPSIARYVNLTPEQQALYEPYARADAAARGRELTPEEHFDSQTISARTTFDAVTHALQSSQLSDADGNDLGSAFDIITAIERVAGQYYGRGGDQQFRLYVELEPDAVQTLRQSTQFFEDHLNTVYHVGYPFSFRQEGSVPNIQVSVSEDGSRADIDVDYRSSKSPQALFNGHLTSANSDIRAGDNIDRHNGRWSGMLAWWRDFFGSFPGGQEGPHGWWASAATEVPTPLPPDRPSGDPIEAPEDAVQEFLTDWLVRQDIDQAMAFMSDRAYACVNIDDDARDEALGPDRARRELASIMREATNVMGERGSLTAAVDAVPPLDPDIQLISHAFDGDFVMIQMTPEESAQYLCGQDSQRDTTASYHGVLFRFKQDGAAALGLLWTEEAPNQWRLVSYQIFEA